MYQDRHVATAEDERIKTLLASFGLGSEYARQQFVDAAFARVNQHSQTTESVRGTIFECAAKFKEAQRKQALDALAELLASDNKVTNEENKFLVMVEEAMGLRK